ncbi:hypothetical protein Poli38472_007965 [Pythium oligandrum]|uniref:GAF domain-containing protein n=1 Tax=Pythium oligandrum TaxID=41045 RepID=A0A8K1FP65_PYTOL|nr:hypothetical protein Poli38472_007965 [Pythium oligandrum]|eukprot:TMW65323.1 hypothetical protein Poli38472_007965 [Pythium oligandrum]
MKLVDDEDNTLHEEEGPKDASESANEGVADTSAGSEPIGSTGAFGLRWPKPQELYQLTLPGILEIVTHNVLAVVPAERSLIYMFDKSTNLLSLQVTSNDDEDAADQEEEESDRSFPPVMGMISACFLQRRCLRMQEPHAHRSLHRDYDVPRDMTLHSLVVAPIILHHRAVGVIQLLNRFDPQDGDAASLSSPPPLLNKNTGRLLDDDEVHLRRTKPAQQQRNRVGFTAKDEQRLIQFASHVAQLLDHKLKQLSPAEADEAAKHLEDRAKNAMELLNMMNEKLEMQATVIPELKMRPRRRSTSKEPIVQAPLARPPPRIVEPPELEVDMLKVIVGISRAQALFRGHHLRKIYRLSELLQQHRAQKRQERSVLVIQKSTRNFFAQCKRTKRRSAIQTIKKAFNAYKLRAKVAEGIHLKRGILNKLPRRRESALPVPSASVPSQPAPPRRVTVTERQRIKSASDIQRHFRGHKVRKQIRKALGFSNISKAIRNIVLLQSFIRGGIARKRVQKMLKEKRERRVPNMVCMRIASNNNETPVIPQAPSYPLPLRTPRHQRNPTVDNCTTACISRLELPLPPRNETRRRHPQRKLRLSDGKSIANNQEDASSGLTMDSRRLVASPLRGTTARTAPNTLALLDRDGNLSHSDAVRAFPTVMFDTSCFRRKKHPPAVQYVESWMLRKQPIPPVEELRSPSSPPKLPSLLPRLSAPSQTAWKDSELLCCFVPAHPGRQPVTPRRLSIHRSSSIRIRPQTTN